MFGDDWVDVSAVGGGVCVVGVEGGRGTLGTNGDEWFGNPVEGNEVSGEGGGWAAGHDCTVCKKEECTAGAKIRTHA